MRIEPQRQAGAFSDMARGILARLFARDDGRDAVRPLYAAIIAKAREPHWYVAGGVPDSLDGRFEMVTAILAAVSLRMETLGDPAAGPVALLSECFVEDMEGQLREQGVGDVSVGKQVGAMMSALGGRMGAYREGLAEGGDLEGALIRNLYRAEPPPSAALAHVVVAYTGFVLQIGNCSLDDLLAARL
jgi:cytochrome b pre-mRNA-processing protein 3